MGTYLLVFMAFVGVITLAAVLNGLMDFARWVIRGESSTERHERKREAQWDAFIGRQHRKQRLPKDRSMKE